MDYFHYRLDCGFNWRRFDGRAVYRKARGLMAGCKIYFTGVIDPETGETVTELATENKPVEDDTKKVEIMPIPEIQGHYPEYVWQVEGNDGR